MGSLFIKCRGPVGKRALMLIAIPLSNLQLQGIEGSKILSVSNHLSALQKKNDSSFRNVYQVKTLLHTMHSLSSIQEITPKQKQCGFEKIFFDQSSSSNTIHDELQILNNILAAKGLLQLKETQWPNATENLGVLFRSSLEKLIPLEQFKGNVSINYEEIFSTCRNPSGLLTYAAGLKTLGDSRLLSSLGQYVVWVMDKTFKNKRYETDHNPHLAKVLERNPGLLSLWTEEIKCDVRTIISEDNKEESFDSEQWLHTKLLVDKHLGSEDLFFFIEYIKTPSADSRKEIFSAIIKKMKMLITEGEHKVLALRKELEEAEKKIKQIETNLKKDKGNEEFIVKMGEEKKKFASLKETLKTFSTSRANDPVVVNLNLQKACLKFAQEGKISDKKSLINHLEEINQSLTFNKTTEFAADVKGLVETLKNKAERNSYGDLRVVFTDDPIDLLLCGTDISGSCQRLDGDPELNKGLLGYLIDGKNRLLAIKEGDRIVARCMLKLLWDGKQPVIYRDRFYPDQISAGHKHALNALAKKVSEKLALPLTAAEGSVPYSHRLHALGGPAPYEYSDGAGGVQKEGRYTIQANILD